MRPRREHPYIRQVSDFSYAVGRKLTSKEWAAIGNLCRQWGAVRVSIAIEAFKKCKTDEKSKFAIPYLATVCRNLAIEDGELTPKRNLTDLTKQDRSLDI